jgi:hypothetical protein
MEMIKAQWASEGDNIRLSMPLTKVDKENRLVSGWASLDNADTQGDIVLAEASQKAFSRFRGNIREMHQPIAVGKMVNFREDSYYDAVSGQIYNGIYATVYVSKGAQDTWEKVLDGTLQGFSIGGSIIDAETQFVKDAGKSIRFVKDYDLVELSLVDSPANQLANIFSITKAADGSNVMKGMVAETTSETVFYCSADQIAKTSEEETVSCGNCGKTMENIGWFEYEASDDKATKMAEVVRSYNSAHDAKQEIPATNEGGVNVAEENKKDEVEAGSPVPAVVEAGEEGKAETEVDSSNENAAVETADNAEVTEEAPADVAKAADVSEVEVEEPDFVKMFNDLKETVIATISKSNDNVKEEVTKTSTLVDTKFGELAAKHDELTQKFDGVKAELDALANRVEGVESDTAVKKSGDLGGSTGETLSKSKESSWGGHFLGISTLAE